MAFRPLWPLNSAETLPALPVESDGLLRVALQPKIDPKKTSNFWDRFMTAVYWFIVWLAVLVRLTSGSWQQMGSCGTSKKIGTTMLLRQSPRGMVFHVYEKSWHDCDTANCSAIRSSTDRKGCPSRSLMVLAELMEWCFMSSVSVFMGDPEWQAIPEFSLNRWCYSYKQEWFVAFNVSLIVYLISH